MKINSFPLFIASSIFLGSYLQAGIVTWDKGGGTLNWVDTYNWDTDAVPLATDDVVFTASGLANSNVIILGANGSGFDLQKQQSSTDAINANITPGTSDLIWNKSNTGSGVIKGTVTKANAGQTVNLIKSGTGLITVPVPSAAPMLPTPSPTAPAWTPSSSPSPKPPPPRSSPVSSPPSNPKGRLTQYTLF